MTGYRIGDAIVEWRSLAQSHSDMESFAAVLTSAERLEAAGFRTIADRHRFMLGRALLREMVGAATGRSPASLRIWRDANGKPAIDGVDDLAFNVSHSGDIVMVALAPVRELGVDVECHRGDIDVTALGSFVFTQRERESITAAAAEARIGLFFRQWVLKEALVKGLGTGLSRDPRRFQVRDARGHSRPEFVGSDGDDIGEGWLIRDVPVPAGYSAALAIRD